MSGQFFLIFNSMNDMKILAERLFATSYGRYYETFKYKIPEGL